MIRLRIFTPLMDSAYFIVYIGVAMLRRYSNDRKVQSMIAL